MSTVLFFYTDGITYKASNVTAISHNAATVEYHQSVINASGMVSGVNYRSIDKSDLLYAIVRNTDNGETIVIPGLYDSFDIVPKGESVRRQTNIEAEAARVAAYRAEKAPERHAKEKAKYEARRAARKALYVQNGSEDTTESESPSVTEQPYVEVQQDTPAVKTPTAKGTRKSVNVVEQLKAVGVSEADMAVLRSLGIMR